MNRKILISLAIILTVILMLGCTGSKDSLYFKTSFQNEYNNLPASIELLEINNNTASFINYASDYMHNYSDIYVGKVDIKGSNLEETILHKGSQDNGLIKLESNNSWAIIQEIVNDDGYYTNIYSYNIKEKKKNLIKSQIPCELNGGFYYLNVSLYENNVFWLEHDKNQKKSSIHMYNLIEDSEKILFSFDFIENREFINFPVTFLSIDEGKLIYDLKTDSTYSIEVYDIKNNELQENISVDNTTVLFFSGALDYKNKLIAVYYLANKDNNFHEAIGFYNLDEGVFEEIIELKQYEAVYRDRIQITDGYLIFNKQLNVSGLVYDHYFGTIVDLKNKNIKTYDGSFELKVQGDYITNLSFDKKYSFNKVHLEIIKKDNIFSDK